MTEFWHNIDSFFWLSASALAVGLVGHFIIFRFLIKLCADTVSTGWRILAKHCFQPLFWTALLILYRWLLPAFTQELYIEKAGRILSVLFIAVFSWLLIKFAYALEDFIFSRLDIGVKNNLRARKIRTQLGVLKQIIIVLILVLAFGSILMTFERIRQLGGAILASAGIIGIIVGIAAQKTIGTFIAGLQIAFTQPIRIDDVVIVEGEWGRIEEITLTYVVVKIWDLRRLIVPITYFIEKPFQNWTRTTAEILGPVFIYADYQVDVDAVRKHLETIVKDSDLWDGKVCGLQVTDTTDKCIQLRALVSAADASTAWTLRCYVRQKLIEFIRDNFPGSLPKIRAFVEKND